MKCYENYRDLERRIKEPTGRAIVVFEEMVQKKFFQRYYHRHNIVKFFNNVKKLLTGTKSEGMFADKMHEPGEMIWKFVGESSVFKTKVRILTSVISLVFLAACYGLLVAPLLQANHAKEVEAGLIWNFVVAFILFIMSVSYRMIMEKLSITRKPNTYLSKSKFVVITTVMFHMMFYLYIPAIFYVETQSGFLQAAKLKSLFIQVFVFLFFSFLIALADVRYRIFAYNRKKHLSRVSESHQVCQKKLHDLVTFPSFPIEFKLMILYKIWSFITFYSFQIPYVMGFMVILLLFLYWNDKHSIYTHYKMQTYLPLELETNFQDIYIYVFMITVCFSYMTIAVEDWEFYGAMIVTAVFFILKIGLDHFEKLRKQQ